MSSTDQGDTQSIALSESSTERKVEAHRPRESGGVDPSPTRKPTHTPTQPDDDDDDGFDEYMENVYMFCNFPNTDWYTVHPWPVDEAFNAKLSYIWSLRTTPLMREAFVAFIDSLPQIPEEIQWMTSYPSKTRKISCQRCFWSPTPHSHPPDPLSPAQKSGEGVREDGAVVE